MDLNDDQVEFVRGFQARFDLFYASPPALKYGAQRNWVLKNVMGEFQKMFGPSSREVLSVSFR